MIHSFLIGAVGGMRSMTPLAAVALAARHRQLPRDNGAPALLAHPLATAGTLVMALGELFGDKLASAPDRIIAPGIAARLVTGAIAGASVAPRRERVAGAAIGAIGACAAAYLTFYARKEAMRHGDQTSTGLLEDAIAVGSAAQVLQSAKRHRG